MDLFWLLAMVVGTSVYLVLMLGGYSGVRFHALRLYLEHIVPLFKRKPTQIPKTKPAKSPFSKVDDFSDECVAVEHQYRQGSTISYWVSPYKGEIITAEHFQQVGHPEGHPEMVVVPDTYVFIDDDSLDHDMRHTGAYKKGFLSLPGPAFRKLYKKAHVAQYARTRGLAPAVNPRTIVTGGEQYTEAELDSLAEDFELKPLMEDEIITCKACFERKGCSLHDKPSTETLTRMLGEEE